MQTVLGAEQKAWFLDQLKTSTATWKIWGNTAGTLDMRADPQNLARRFHQTLARSRLRNFRHGRSQQRLYGTRRDL